MKTFVAIVIVAVLLGVHPVSADCSFSGPGISPGSRKCSSFPSTVEVETEGCYKFVYQGCEAKGNVGSGGGGGGGNNHDNDDDRYHWDDDDDDDDDDNGGGSGTGPIELEASCRDNKPTPKSCSSKVTYTKVDDFNKSPLKKCGSSPCVFKADKTPIKCKMKFNCKGNAPKPNGCFNIIGTIQKDPAPPVGNLAFAVGEYSLGIGTHPDGTATIIRD